MLAMGLPGASMNGRMLQIWRGFLNFAKLGMLRTIKPPQSVQHPAGHDSLKFHFNSGKGNPMTDPAYVVQHISSWNEFREAVTGAGFQSWAFRGQSSDSWPLYSSLSRYLKLHEVHPDAWPKQEQRILRIFKRKAHLLLPSLPNVRLLAELTHSN